MTTQVTHTRRGTKSSAPKGTSGQQIAPHSWMADDYARINSILSSGSVPDANGCRMWNNSKNGVLKYANIEYKAQKLAFFAANPNIRMEQQMAVGSACGNNRCVESSHLSLQWAPVKRKCKWMEPLSASGRAAIVSALPRMPSGQIQGYTRFMSLDTFMEMDSAQLKQELRDAGGQVSGE